MKTVIRPEAEMKDSGIEYLGKIPTTWGKCRLKNVCTSFNSNITTSIINKEHGNYKIFGASGLIGYIEFETMQDEYLGIVKDGAGVGRIGSYPSHSSLLGTLAYIIPNDGINMKWLKYVIENMNLGESIDKTTIPHIYFSTYGNNYIPFPSSDEQQSIADYLDETCSKINEIIAEAKASIDEYKELRQGIIFEAVTKGLDKNVEMKSTSVGWIGTVPSHWRVAKIRQVAEFYNGDRSSKYPSGDDIVSEGIIFITSNNLGYIVLNTNISTNKFITKQKYDDLGGAKLRINDIVFCLRGSVGKCAINKTFDEGTIASSLVVIRAKKVDADYLNYVLQNHRITDEAIVNAIGIGSLNLAAHDISEFYMPIPPEREMQDIVRYLDDKVGNVDDLISEKESLINDLEAYKKSLIYEVVTGKRRVV